MQSSRARRTGRRCSERAATPSATSFGSAMQARVTPELLTPKRHDLKQHRFGYAAGIDRTLNPAAAAATLAAEPAAAAAHLYMTTTAETVATSSSSSS